MSTEHEANTSAGSQLVGSPGENAGLITQPRALTQQRVQTQYVTAMSVQLPRSLDVVRKQFLEEARLMGEGGYYGWGVGKDRIEGPSQAMAYAAARCWGNCAVDQLPLEESRDAWIFTSVFVDCETGFTLTRKFRQSKRWTVYGKLDPDRKDDIRFQIGQTKGDRNVILKALPKWLIDQGMDEAKAGAREKLEQYIKKHGLPAAIDYALKELAKLGIDETRVCFKFSVAKTSALSLDNLVIIAGDIKALQQGQEYPEAIYPDPASDDQATDKQSVTEKAKAAMRKQAQAPAPEPQPDAELCKEFLNAVELIEVPDDLTQLAKTVDGSNELTDSDKDTVHAAIGKRRAKLTRGEKSNAKT